MKSYVIEGGWKEKVSHTADSNKNKVAASDTLYRLLW